MEQYFIVIFFAFGASLLTFFSGFGLGTILTPVFVLFFPIDIAIGLTAIVHLLNNLLKMGLIGRFLDKTTVIRFGLPAIASAIIGSLLLSHLQKLPVLLTYQFFDETFSIKILNLVVGSLITLFAIFEWSKILKNTSSKKLFLGGILSGFFGGLSGHQGALRSMFLVRMRFNKETYIATGTAIACLIDLGRLSIYTQQYIKTEIWLNINILLAAILAAFAGAFLGKKVLKKVTISSIENIVSVLLIVMGLSLALGII